MHVHILDMATIFEKKKDFETAHEPPTYSIWERIFGWPRIYFFLAVTCWGSWKTWSIFFSFQFITLSSSFPFICVCLSGGSGDSGSLPRADHIGAGRQQRRQKDVQNSRFQNHRVFTRENQLHRRPQRTTGHARASHSLVCRFVDERVWMCDCIACSFWSMAGRIFARVLKHKDGLTASWKFDQLF